MNLDRHPVVTSGLATPVQATTNISLDVIAALVAAGVDAMFILRLREGGEFGAIDYALLDAHTIANLVASPDRIVQTMIAARPARDVLDLMEAITAWTPDGSRLPTTAAFPAYESLRIDTQRLARELRVALETVYTALETDETRDHVAGRMRVSAVYERLRIVYGEAQARECAVPSDAWTARLVTALKPIEMVRADGLAELGIYERILRAMYEILHPELAARFDLSIEQNL